MVTNTSSEGSRNRWSSGTQYLDGLPALLWRSQMPKNHHPGWRQSQQSLGSLDLKPPWKAAILPHCTLNSQVSWPVVLVITNTNSPECKLALNSGDIMLAALELSEDCILWESGPVWAVRMLLPCFPVGSLWEAKEPQICFKLEASSHMAPPLSVPKISLRISPAPSAGLI